MAWQGMSWHSKVWYNIMVQYGKVWHGVAQYCVVSYTIEVCYSMVWWEL